MTFTAIDFEASSLPRHGRSFPIEVGIADERGVRSWLIRPAPEWAGWTWTGEAQALHGLTLDQLHGDGRPASDVMGELAASVAGRRLVADSNLDRGWMATLAAAARVDALPIDHVGDWLDRFGSSDAEIAAAQTELRNQPYRRHRAGGDAAWLFAMLARLCRAARAREERSAFDWPIDAGARRPASEPV